MVRGATAVVLPGTGSDDDYVRRAFSRPLQHLGVELITPRPDPRDLIAGYLEALEATATSGPILAGGISIGAAVATAWALRHPDRVIGVLAALPAWTGDPDDAPAAHAARYSAQQLRHDGLAAVTARMRASSPAWLADELTRSWTAQWPQLPDALEQAAAYVAPTCAELSGLAVPMGVTAAVDDAVHPLHTATEWASAAPRSALITIALDDIGADPAALGRACVTALSIAGDGELVSG